jgi:hypothetical protein
MAAAVEVTQFRRSDAATVIGGLLVSVVERLRR